MTKEQIAWLAARVPHIPALSADVKRPYWSIVIPTHKRHDLLPVCINSILKQGIDFDDMEIEVMDDASPGSETETIVRDLGQGRISYFRHPENVGQFANVNEGIRRARGHWVHVIHDDDWVEPNFYQTLKSSIPEQSSVGAAFTALVLSDSAGYQITQWSKEQDYSGILDNWLWKVATTARIQPPAVVVRREVYEKLGGYSPEFPWPADWEMWVRIASHYSWFYQPNAVAVYRNNEVSVSSKAKRTGDNISDIRKVIDFFLNYQSENNRPALRRASTRYWVEFAFATAIGMIRSNDYEGAANQLRECLALDPSKEVVEAITRLSQTIK